MLTVRMRINPTQGEVTYDIEGSTDELTTLDLAQINKLNALANKIASMFDVVKKKEGYPHSHRGSIKTTKDHKKDQDIDELPIDISIPQELIEEILKLEERIRIPVLWYFSTRQKMTVKDFLMACARKGLTLNSSWHPSAGGNFKRRLINEDKMFHETEKVGRDAILELTDIGRLKIMKELEKLKGHAK